jgi:hypothetical protein
MRRAILTFAAAVMVSFPAIADVTPQFLQEVCLEDANQIEGAICLAYVAGVADSESGTGKFCVPVGTSNEELVGVVRAFIQENPLSAPYVASRNHNASVPVGLALVKKFPCN